MTPHIESRSNMGFEPDGPVGMALTWLNAALTCKEFPWDSDQRAFAEETLAAATLWLAAPSDVILYCPKCHEQHIDAPELEIVKEHASHTEVAVPWNDPPHRSHLCQACGFHWRPADFATRGVASINTKGKLDGTITPRPKYTPLEKAQAGNWQMLRNLLGYIEAGEGASVTIFQDDATREWTVRVEGKDFYGSTLEDALRTADLGDSRTPF